MKSKWSWGACEMTHYWPLYFKLAFDFLESAIGTKLHQLVVQLCVYVLSCLPRAVSSSALFESITNDLHTSDIALFSSLLSCWCSLLFFFSPSFLKGSHFSPLPFQWMFCRTRVKYTNRQSISVSVCLFLSFSLSCFGSSLSASGFSYSGSLLTWATTAPSV